MAMRRRSIQVSRVLRRRRARRLLSAFVRLRFEAVKPVGVFDASHVEWMLRSGKPDDAHYYLECFLHRVPVQDRVSSPLSIQLIAHVGVFKTLAKVVAGGEEGEAVAALFANPSEYILRSPASVRLHKIIAVMHADRTRASQLWENLKPQALDTIMDLVARCPELQGEARLPRKRTLQRTAAPHGLPQCPGRRWKTTKRASADVLVRKFPQKRLCMTQGRKLSAHSINASSQFVMRPMKIERNALQPANVEAEEFPSNASSSVASNTKSEQIAPKPINLAGFLGNGTSDCMISDMQIEPAVPQAPGVDATVVAGMLGRDRNLGNDAGVGASKSRKRKMIATPEKNTETSSSMKIWEGSCSHL